MSEFFLTEHNTEIKIAKSDDKGSVLNAIIVANSEWCILGTF